MSNAVVRLELLFSFLACLYPFKICAEATLLFI